MSSAIYPIAEDITFVVGLTGFEPATFCYIRAWHD